MITPLGMELYLRVYRPVELELDWAISTCSNDFDLKKTVEEEKN